jgi:hypothetical protein
MGLWYQTFDNTFFLAVGGILAGTIALIIKTMMRSRCDDVTVCCVHVHRRVDLETNENLERIIRRQNSTSDHGLSPADLKVDL